MIRTVICPICDGEIKTMYKPDLQYHCRGRCGLVIRLQNGEKEDYKKIKELLNTQNK